MKAWTKPQLIVLAKGTPDESVLAACNANKAVPVINNHACRSTDPNCGVCKLDSAS
jgi:hypothetical protein